MASRLSLDSVPIIDNHCHAAAAYGGARRRHDGSKFRTLRQCEEMYARGFIEARVPPDVWRAYAAAVQREDATALEEIDRQHQTKYLMEQSLTTYGTTTLNRAHQLGCSELYGEWDDRERLQALAAEARKDGVARLYDHILDKLNCLCVLNDVPRLDKTEWPTPRYRWIARIDPFLYPFGPDNLTMRGTEPARFHARFANKLNIALEEQGLDATPTDFADYVAFVERTLDTFLARNVVTLKIVSAYVRSLEFLPVAEPEAVRVFRDLARGRKAESRVFEDYMARRILLWAANHGLPVQVHAGFGHSEPGMDIQAVSPLMLQAVLMDERYSNLKLVLLHGAYPFCSEAGALAWTYGNVYLDFSWMVYLHHHFLIDRLSEWLEMLPAHKLLLGTDSDLPEQFLGAMRLGRRALTAALGRGIDDGIWSASQADSLGERVCYRNASDVYGLGW
jgi:uncharacterized protein